MAKVKEICEQALRRPIEEMGFELVEVSYVKEGKGMSLIFTIDCEKGVTVDDCELVSKKIDPLLDELNPTEDAPYTLVVSSLGLDRPIVTDRDFSRALGKEVEVTLFQKIDGKKNFEGVLEAFDSEKITLSDNCFAQKSKTKDSKLLKNDSAVSGENKIQNKTKGSDKNAGSSTKIEIERNKIAKCKLVIKF